MLSSVENELSIEDDIAAGAEPAVAHQPDQRPILVGFRPDPLELDSTKEPARRCGDAQGPDEWRLAFPGHNGNEFVIDILPEGDRPVVAAHEDNRVARTDRTSRIDRRRRSKPVFRSPIGLGGDEMIGGIEHLR